MLAAKGKGSGLRGLPSLLKGDLQCEIGLRNLLCEAFKYFSCFFIRILLQERLSYGLTGLFETRGSVGIKSPLLIL